MGFVTGPEPLVTQINLHSQASCLHASGISQTLVLAYLRHIGAFATTEASAMAPFDAHVASVVEFYRNQRDAAVAAAKKHLAGKTQKLYHLCVHRLGTDSHVSLVGCRTRRVCGS